MHTAGEAFITPGKELAPFDTPLGRVGMLVCKDRSVPENFRALSVQGAEMVFLPMDGAGGPTNTETLRQRAKDNVCWIVVANTWSCAVIDPTGDVYLEKYESECVSVQRMGPDDQAKEGLRAKFKHRRPDLYDPIAETLEDGHFYDETGDITEEGAASGAGLREFVQRRERLT